MSNKKVQLSKEEIAELKKRLANLQKETTDSTQSFLPFQTMTPDGICQLAGKNYARCIEFGDINYYDTDIDEQNIVFSSYCELLSYFDSEIKFQLLYENHKSNKDYFIQNFEIPDQDDDFNDIRKEYSDMLKEKYLDGFKYVRKKRYIIFKIKADDLKTARFKLNEIADEVCSMLSKSLRAQCKMLDGNAWLETLYETLNPYSKDQFIFDWNYCKKSGHSPKDFVAPPSIKFKKNDFNLADCKGSVQYIELITDQLSDNMLADYLENNDLISVSLQISSIDTVDALKISKMALTDLEAKKIANQQKALQDGYDPEIMSPDLLAFIDELKNSIEELNSKSEKLYLATIVIRNIAKTSKQFINQKDSIKRLTQKNGGILFPLQYMQRQGLEATLPLCINNVPISRSMSTSALAAFLPFKSNELFHSTDSVYYGINPATNCMILGDRTRLPNPNALVLGFPGSGKSFSVKREILDRFLKSIADIIICDPEGEYFPLVNALGGQVIPINTNSDKYINPLDIVYQTDSDDDPISDKANFILSMLELICGGAILSDAKAIIDQCVVAMYRDFFNNDPSPEKMPILSDLLKRLREAGPVVKQVADSLSMYVTGSQNVFNHRTNVDLNNRVVCFDIKKLGSQLKPLGMLVVQEIVWNKVSENREQKKSTYYYIDEFHLLLKEPQTARYSVDIWKRFRKWGGIPTGITQNVKDLLSSREVTNIFENSDFIYMLNQAAGDRQILADQLNISPHQLSYVTHSGEGEGLLFYGNVILPFVDRFPTDLELYRIMTTKLTEVQEAKEA